MPVFARLRVSLVRERRVREKRRKEGVTGSVTARQKFQSVLQSDGTALGWTIVRLPFDPVQVWPQRKGLRALGTIQAVQPPRARATARPPYAFRTTLFRTSEGSYILLVNKGVQKGAGVTRGSRVLIELEPDTAERVLVIPPELERFLRQDRSLKKWYGALSPSHRKFIADHVAQPKSPAARANRGELWAERMLLTMEGEQFPPPILQAAFNRQPAARAAWLALTPIQRRGHLLGIFMCQGPESRHKRTQKAIDEALRRHQKRQSL
jgi:uncharacterized protein YdeI (YjbR/CyaY-like superfamily)